jgi:hypothetical protein
VYGKRKKEKYKSKEIKKIYMCMREWKRVIEKKKIEEKERRGVARKIWEGWIKWKKK